MNRHAYFALAAASAGASAAAILVPVGAVVAQLLLLGERTLDDNAPLRAAGVITMVIAPAVFVLVGLGTWILGYLAAGSSRNTLMIAGSGVLVASLYMPVAGLLSGEPMSLSRVGELATVFALLLVPLAIGVVVWWKLVARALTKRWSGP
jgi:hypothetical protein